MKDKILSWLFRGYSKRLKNFYKKSADIELEVFKKSLDIKDLIRSRFNGITPVNPREDSVLAKYLSGLDDGSRLVFLAKAKDIVNNETFKVVSESLILDSVHEAILKSNDMAEVNFNRATINGLMLLEDEINYLASLYEEERERKSEMSNEEKLQAI